MTPLDRLARHHGLTLAYDALSGEGKRRVPDSTKRHILSALGVDPGARPEGAPAPHRMEVPEGARCWLPPSLEDAPGWGVFCQLYELRSERNWGIGDFSDLAALARLVGQSGADFLGTNPIHALFSADPERCSPFFPSNRRFLNPLYIAPDLLGLDPPPEVAQLRLASLLDYPTIARAKMDTLRDAFDAGCEVNDLDSFADAGGEELRRHAQFEAISAQMVAEGHGAGWRDWPTEFHDPEAAAVKRLVRELQEDVRFHLWIQKIARQQLSDAEHAARVSGMRIGLYLDLAVGEAPDGSATWSGAADALEGLTVGSPPDMFARQGQNWGLSAPSPTAMQANGFRAFREMLEAQMRDAGALRIDHVMMLWQLFLVPEGEAAVTGTHLRYPFADMVATLAAESQKHHSLVIGEDLGFVPAGFRNAMARADILSYRILIFEQTDRGFKGLSRYPRKALACLSTHDLPVLAEWWRGEDVARRHAVGLVDEEMAAEHAAHRETERHALLRTLRRAGCLRGRVDAEAETLPPAVLDAAHLFLARTPSILAGLRLADLAGPEVPTNVPGTSASAEYPNWRPRSPTDLADLPDHPVFAHTVAMMRAERPRPNEAPE